MKKNKKILFALFTAALVLLNGCVSVSGAGTAFGGKTPAPAVQDNAAAEDTPEEIVTEEDAPAEEDDVSENNVPENPDTGMKTDTGRVTGIHFTYDMYSGDQFYLDVIVEKMSGKGAQAEIEKRIGPMNYTGVRKEGTIRMNGEQVQALRDILGRYDLKLWTECRLSSYGTSPSRSLYVFEGSELVYRISWNTQFPETLPPQEDIMYAELYNFFNDLISAEPGWEDVRSDDLDDPRDNPAYYERTVTWFGNEVRLVPGTGTWYENGAYAEIDYEGRDWWIEEGFTGSWTLDEENPTNGLNPPKSASLTVNEDGSVLFVLDGEEWPGRVAPTRRYRDSTGILLEKGYEDRACTVALMQEESYRRIHLYCYPGPVPEPQFPPIDVYLLKVE